MATARTARTPWGPPRTKGVVPAAATEALQHYAAERAIDDPVKLAKAARVFRLALARGLVDTAGNVIAAEGGDGGTP